MNFEKEINSYSKRYKSALQSINIQNIDPEVEKYKNRLIQVYESEEFKRFNQYPSTDTTAYSNLPRHVRMIRHSDLSDGDSCHDEIIDKKFDLQEAEYGAY